MAEIDALNPGLSRAELARLSVFAAADLDALEPVLRNCPIRSLQQGETLIEAGAGNRYLFLLLSGELAVHLESQTAPALTRLRAGETVGEISLIDGEPASA